MFGQHIQNIASFFGTFDVSLPFARPLSDKLGRRISVLIGAASYVIFFIGIAFSPNIQVAYVAAVLGGVQTGPFPGDLSGNFCCHIGSGLPVKTPMICFVGAFVIGYVAAGGVLQMAAATVNDLFPNIKGIITSLVMIASSLCNYTILSAAAKMSSMQVIMMNIVITVIGVLLAVFVNVRYGSLLAKTEQ